MELILLEHSSKFPPPKTVQVPGDVIEIVLGRHPQNLVCLKSISISRRHAVIKKAAAGYEIVEQKAVNGVYVNGTRLPAGASKPLAQGDHLQLGVKPSSRGEASSNSEYFVYQLSFAQNGKRKSGDTFPSEAAAKSAKLDINNSGVLQVLQQKADAEAEAAAKAKEEARLLAAAEAKAEAEKLALANELHRLQEAQNAQQAKEEALQQEIAALQSKQAQTSEELEKKLQEREKELQEAKDEQTKESNNMLKIMKEQEQQLVEARAHEAKLLEVEAELKATKEEQDKLSSRTTQLAVQEKITGLLEDQLQCSICSELMVHPKGFVCSHTFCGHCIDKWLQKKKECPVCRQRVVAAATNYLIANLIDKAVEEMSEENKLYRSNLIKSREEEMIKKPSKGKKAKEPAARGRRANAPSTSRRAASGSNAQSSSSSSHSPSTVTRPAAGSLGAASFSFSIVDSNYRIPRIPQQSNPPVQPTRTIATWLGASSNAGIRAAAATASVSAIRCQTSVVRAPVRMSTPHLLTPSQRENTSAMNSYHTTLGNIMYRFSLPVSSTFPVALQAGDGQLHWVKPETVTSTQSASSIRCVVTHVTKP